MLNNIKECLLQGLDVNYKTYLSICKLSNHGIKRNQYQVHSYHPDETLSFSHLYDDIDIAVDKFVAIKNNIDKYRESQRTNRKLSKLSTETEAGQA